MEIQKDIKSSLNKNTMKHSILILAMLFLISSCNNDEDGLITENATVYRYLDSGFGGSQCHFVIEIENNKIFAIDKMSSILSKLKYGVSKKLKITYRLTKNKLEGKHCYHKSGRLKKPVVLIEEPFAKLRVVCKFIF